ncbi:MAG TPA: tail fiber protein [Bacteroidia bacterium]|jgi:microcystin-dependent protein|nr:tail fiber protein [Bacteroidia bacterium]
MNDDDYVGAIKIFAGNYIPANYMECDGTDISINAYQLLFSVIGTTYGGDGVQNFALPNLKGAFPIGITVPGTTPPPPPAMIVSLGESGGATSLTLTSNNLPSHTHSVVPDRPAVGHINVSSANATHSTPVTGDSIAVPGSGSGHTFAGTDGFIPSRPSVALNNATLSMNSVNITNSSTGGNQPFSTMSPYLGVRYLIRVNGILAAPAPS